MGDYAEKPRPDQVGRHARRGACHYEENPVLHYTIGTKVRPSMLKDFEEFGVHELPEYKPPRRSSRTWSGACNSSNTTRTG